MADKAKKKKNLPQKNKAIEPEQRNSSWLRIFNFNESYSSLLLGIIVVIITTVILIFLIKDRSTLQNKPTQSVSSTKVVRTTEDNKIAKGEYTPTITDVPTLLPTSKPTNYPTIQPTKHSTLTINETKPTSIPTITVQPTVKIVQPTAKPSIAQIQKMANGQKVYTVQSGDNLWTIAEKYYQSGYNWVDIADANKLSNPSLLYNGMKLNIPNVTPKTATVIAPQTPNITEYGPKITTNTYTVQKGDNLWGISVRAYGDGYKWSEVAKVNNITTPNVINSGLVLKLPRTSAVN